MGLLGSLVGLAGGLFGANQAHNDQKKAQRRADQARKDSLAYANKGIAANAPLDAQKLAVYRQLLELAGSYDPHKADQASVAQASHETTASIREALRNLNGHLAASGGLAGNSSAFNVNAQAITDRAADPLKEFIAQQAATEFQRKIAAVSQAQGAAPGSLGDAYFKAAAVSSGTPAQTVQQPDTSGAQQLIASSLSALLPQLFPKKTTQASPSYNPANSGYGPIGGSPAYIPTSSAFNPEFERAALGNSFFSNPLPAGRSS